MNPKEIVARGYDRIGTSYAVWANGIESQARTEYTSVLLENLPFGAQVLELGCGSGIPTTRRLAERFSLTGVDISNEQINLARENIPAARFLCADMGQLDFPPASFDAVAAFYSIIHVPRDEHAELLRTIANWLRQGGLVVATMGAGSTESDLVDDWLGWGAPMYWSHFDADTNCALIQNAGFHILSAQQVTEDEDGRPVTFLWVVARKPD